MTDKNLQPKLDAGTGGSIEALIQQWRKEHLYYRGIDGDCKSDAWNPIRADVKLECAEELAAALLTRRDQLELDDGLNLGDRLKEGKSLDEDVLLLPTDAIRVWFRPSDKTLHIGALTLTDAEAKRIVLDLLEFLPPLATRRDQPEQRTEHWSVEVSRNGENLVMIESNFLSGKPDFSDADADTIREAAEHLRSFIGARRDAPQAQKCTACNGTGGGENRMGGPEWTCAVCGGTGRISAAGRDADPAKEPGWQPIETAPRDGTKILAGYRHELYSPEVVEFSRDHWRTSDGEAIFPPQLWIPIPAPPVAAKEPEPQ